MFDGSLPEIDGMRGLGDAELIAAVAGWGRVESAAAARKMAAMAEMFRRRTGCEDADDRSNWFVDPEASAVSEVAAAQNITESLAMFQTHRAVMLTDRLPKVAALFAAGMINDLLVRAIVARTALITDPSLMAAVDADLAAQITRWGPRSQKKTTAAIDAIVETHDPGALRRVKDAEKDRGLQFGFISDPAGYMTVWARMYAPDGAAFEQRVLDMARTLCPDDPRSADERRNDALAAVATGTTLRCECENPDCPATGKDQPAKDVTFHVIVPPHTLHHAQHTTDTQQPAEAPAEAPLPDASDHSAECRPADTQPPTETPAPQDQSADVETTTEQEGAAAECRPADRSDAQPVEEPKATGSNGNTDGTQPAPAPSPTPAAAFVIGAGIANAAVVAAFLKRATIRPLKHPGNAPPAPH
ncbi:DUF222 domain-containing protein, partial [Mycolicibacterium litorale]|uniref:DUF222 domain-containing protein n=1 Tax=Mycolicibacterium litorale TaxID=758802 RepID=UPI003CEE1864